MRSILIALLFISYSVWSQGKKDLGISISAGALNSPYYKNAKAGGFYGFDFDYHLSARHVLAVNYFAGNHSYFDDVLSNDPTSGLQPNGTNSDAEYRTFSIMYKYKILDNEFLSIVPGVGAGAMTHTREYPYKEINKAYPALSSWTDLVFPIMLDFNFKINPKWQAGIKSGFLIHPDYPIIALHIGPRVSCVIK